MSASLVLPYRLKIGVLPSAASEPTASSACARRFEPVLGREDQARRRAQLFEHAEQVPTAAVDGSGVREHAQATAAQATTQARELAGEQLIDSAKHGVWSLSV